MEILRIDLHTFFRLLASAQTGALLAFGMMAVIAPGFLRRALTGAPARTPPWGWLGAFSIAKALSVGAPLALGMIERMLPMEVFRVIYLSLAGIAWTLAFEFGVRWSAPRSRGWRAAPLLALAGWTAPLLLREWSLAAVGVAWLSAAPAAAFIAVGAWRAMRRGDLQRRNAILAIGLAALSGLAVLETLGFSYSDWFQGWTANTLPWFERPAPWVPISTALSLVLLTAWSWWMIAQFVLASAQSRISRIGIAAVIGPAVGCLALSGFIVVWLDNAARRHNIAVRPTVYGVIRGVAAQLDPILAEVAPNGVLRTDWTAQARSPLASRDMLDRLPGTEGLVVWALRNGEVTSLLKIPDDLPSIPAVPIENPKLLFAARPTFERRESPFTCPAMLDERSLHVVHSVPLGVRLPTGEPVWLGLRQNFAAWDGYKREVYVQGIFTLALVGVVGGALGIFVVRVRREHELQLARDRAQAANHAKSEFIAFVSHELRTPLQSVIGYADILRGRPDHPARNEYLDALAAQGRDLLEVVNELLDFSAAEAGRLTLNVSEFSLHEVIDDCARVVAPDVHAKRLRWEVSIDRSVPPGVSGDRARVRQVLLNVIGNAVKFTDCGSVTVKAERVEPATTERTHSIGPNPPPAPVAIRFVVLDTGPGIPELERSRLFEVFGRLDDKVRGGKTGSGVGLALSRKLSALMGGTIALENRSDGVAGAVATVVMSFAGASDVYVSPHRESQPEGIGDDTSRLPAVDRPSPARGVDRKTRPVRILLAEDHPHVREVVCEMLASLGCAVNTTDNGLEATTLAREGDYDVILLDTWMPGMSGMQVAREIHATLPNDSRPWLIGISASSRPEDRAACVAAGMNDFLAKPIDCAALRAALQRSGRTPSDSELPESATVDAAGVAAPEREWKSLFGANFEEETTAIVVSLARAVEIGDWQLVHQRAHYLENSAVWVRQDDVAACCATLGQAVRAGDHDGARAALGRLRDTRRQHRAREETS